MSRTRSIARTICLVLIVLSSGHASALDPETHPDVRIAATSTEQEAIAEWAIGRFTAAGLRLPDVTIEIFASDQSNCGGVPARTYLDRTPAAVKICWSDPFVLLHELAHVWEARNVSKETREDFSVSRVGVRSWASREVDWDERGREHAANVIAWGLLEDPYPVSRTYPNDPDSMRAGFAILTGTEPLHDGGHGVRKPDRSLFGGRANPALESGR